VFRPFPQVRAPDSPLVRCAAGASCSANRLGLLTREDPEIRPRYLAIMAYLPYSSAVESGAARLRERAVRRHHVATTFGYGPRFLHSTGQFHKGGPPVGAFVQIVDEPQEDLEVPGEAYTFGTLIRAQADGDLQTLRSHGLDAVRAGREIL